MLAHFVASLYLEDLVASTVKCYLSAVRYSQIVVGLGDPRIHSMPQLEYVLQGMKRRTAGRASRERWPITPSLLSFAPWRLAGRPVTSLNEHAAYKRRGPGRK